MYSIQFAACNITLINIRKTMENGNKVGSIGNMHHRMNISTKSDHHDPTLCQFLELCARALFC